MIYVTSDLHGYPLVKFKELLEKVNFSKNDYCYVLGDVIDRGPESVGLLKWIMNQQNIELIMGNHEAMLLDCSFLFDINDELIGKLKEENLEAFNTWIANGGRKTIKDLSSCDKETVFQIVEYLRKAPLYVSVCVNNKDFLLVHGGLGGFSPQKNIRDYSADELLWERPELAQNYFDDTVTVFGHTPTHFYGVEHLGKAVRTSTWIDIDTGAAYGGAPMLLRLNDMKEFY